MQKIFILIICFIWTFSFAQINPDNIKIARDQWGVPHIFAKTDAECAYGLAWANAEDSFEKMQEMLFQTNGLAGRILGKEGAIADFFSHAINAEKLVETQFDSVLTPAYIKYLKGYCQGINAFAKKHPKRVVNKRLFPVTPKMIVRAYAVSFPALCGVAGAVSDIMAGKHDEDEKSGLGSNLYCMNSPKTSDGKTYFCANPHFRTQGPFTFYEAHLHSEEGMNMTGVIFQGGTSIYMGNNENLAWSMTWNYFDKVDTYELEMHPTEKNTYKLDNKWMKLEERPVKLKVKVLGFLIIGVKKTTYWSVYGPTFKSKNGKYYAVRAPSMMTVGAGQQYYYMSKAKNYNEFKAALQLQDIPQFNIGYADRDQNIYYIHSGLMAKRDTSYNWDKVVPGNTSKTLWNECHKLEEMQQVFNPNCGYVYNTNNTPYHCTCPAEYPKKTVPSYSDRRPDDNNRARRFQELVSAKDKLTYDDFKAIKFDSQYPKTSTFLKSLKPLYEIDPKLHPELEELLTMIQNWDRVVTPQSVEATLLMGAINYIFKKKGYSDAVFVLGMKASKEDYIAAFSEVKKKLEKYHKTWKVPLEEVQKFKIGKEQYSVAGYAELLMANYATNFKSGIYQVTHGDTYIHFAKFGKDGPEEIETLLPFGSTTYSDNTAQLKLYNEKKLKKMSLNKQEILQNAKTVYHPK